MSDNFLFVTKDIEVSFEETAGKTSALIKIVAVELNKTSQNNPPTEYRIEEGDTIAASLIGSPVYFGTNIFGKHDRTDISIGKVERTENIGDKIWAWVRITREDLVQRLKNGAKFLFSVGGQASFAEAVKKAGKTVLRMIGAKCNHLQMVDVGTKVGFPSAKMLELVEINETVAKMVEINETVMMTGPDPIDEMIEREIENSVPFYTNIFSKRGLVLCT